MSLLDFIRLLKRNYRFIGLCGLLTAGLVAVLTAWQQPSYRSEAMVYTGIASGYTIEKQESQRTDYYAVNNAFDNLLNIIQSRYTLEESALRLLARHLLLEGPRPEVMEAAAFEQLQEQIPADVREELVSAGDFEATLHKLRLAYHRDTSSVVRKLLLVTPSPYNLDRLRDIRPVRKNNSDMIQLHYTAADPGIARHTLSTVLEVFTQKFHNLKTSETGQVIRYFEEKVAQAEARLQTAENELSEYRARHSIINYSEQTKFIAEKHEDALEALHQVQQDRQASEAALRDLESKLAIRQELYTRNDTILNLRRKLANVQTELAMLMAQKSPEAKVEDVVIEDELGKVVLQDGYRTGGSTGRKQEYLEGQVRNLEAQLGDAIRRRYAMEHSTEGIPTEPLTQQWVKEVVEVEKYRARAAYFSERLADIDEQYREYAPLGSELSRRERAIDVAERAYLENLHSLNMARLRKQNLQLSSQLRVVDPPNFPAEPEPSKRKLLVVVGLLMGLVLSTGTLTGMELFDQSLNHPDRAAQALGMTPTGAFPVDSQRDENFNQHLRPLLVNQLLARCRLMLPEDLQAGKVGVISMRTGEGKTTLLDVLAGEDALQAGTVEQLQWTEMPPLVQQPMDRRRAAGIDLWLLVVRTDRRWSPADAQALAWLQQISDKPIALALNGLSQHHLDHFLGETPRPRNGLHRRLKRLAHLEFTATQMPEAS